MCGKGVRAVASQNVRQAPERVGHHADPAAAAVRRSNGTSSSSAMLGMTSVPRGADGGEQCLDQGVRGVSDLREGGVDQKDASGGYAEGLELWQKHYNCNITEGRER